MSDKSIRIGILTDYANSDLGGHSKNILYLSKTLKQMGHSVTII